MDRTHGQRRAGQLAGITLAVEDPTAVAARWADVLGVPLLDAPQPTLALDSAEVGFVAVADECAEGLVEIALAGVPRLADGPNAIELGGVRLRALATA